MKPYLLLSLLLVGCEDKYVGVADKWKELAYQAKADAEQWEKSSKSFEKTCDDLLKIIKDAQETTRRFSAVTDEALSLLKECKAEQRAEALKQPGLHLTPEGYYELASIPFEQNTLEQKEK